MNYHLTCSSAILCSFLAAGCSTHTVKQTSKVSSSAVTYTSYMNEVLEDTKQYVIDMDTQQLIRVRSSDTRKKNELKLKQKNEALADWIGRADQLREQNILLQRYFEELQRMIDSQQDNDRSESLATISRSLSEINQTQTLRRGNYERDKTLTYKQTGFVGNLSQSVVSNHYAHKVKQALLRDRNIINQQIALQKQQLKMISSIYKRRTRLANKSHYAENVLGPYVNVEKNMFEAGSWAQSRSQWFKNSQALKKFDKVEKANEAFSKAWVDFLKGKKDAGAVGSIIGEVNSAVQDATKLRDSYINPSPVNGPNVRIIPQQY